ncbi:hypothetical protein C6P86_15970 [Burkholderia multivorans]|nr:hypothetical protein C6P86_15970 [Burkholderia multivorans]PRE78411.1 hypothetical protein C6Q00_25325 [Burkholderia multivorans]PRG19429.1 hypothetical protein C6T57_21460 [Burkholderia multivorans]
MRPCEAGSAREAHGAASRGVSILRAGDRFDCPPNRDSQSESSQLMRNVRDVARRSRSRFPRAAHHSANRSGPNTS